jgi:radical SAM protein (TIGR01212 family)
MKEKYNEKVYRIGLSIGEKCPHRLKSGGCIFCIPGTFTGEYQQNNLSITEQCEIITKKMIQKLKVTNFVAYFQDETSTAGNVEHLKKMYYEALNFPNVHELIISTRPDFISKELITMLDAIEKPVTIELGLQSIHDKTLEFLNRGHTFADFEKAIDLIKKSKCRIGVHLITGIPTESLDERLETIKYVGQNENISEIKLHHLVVYENTELAEISQKHNFHYDSLEDYFVFLEKALPFLRKDQVISRIFTSNVRRSMIALNQFPKTKVDWLNKLLKYLDEKNVIQGSKISQQ